MVGEEASSERPPSPVAESSRQPGLLNVLGKVKEGAISLPDDQKDHLYSAENHSSVSLDEEQESLLRECASQDRSSQTTANLKHPRRSYKYWALWALVVTFFILLLVGGIVFGVLIQKYQRRARNCQNNFNSVVRPRVLLPTFNSSLSCHPFPTVNQQFSHQVISIPVGKEQDHYFDIEGDARGTITITDAYPDAKGAIQYDIAFGAFYGSLDKFSLVYPDTEEDGTVKNSSLVIKTPQVSDPRNPYSRQARQGSSGSYYTTMRPIVPSGPFIRPGPSQCQSRFDVTIYVPRDLKKLYISAHAISHIQFAPDSHVELEELIIRMHAEDNFNAKNLVALSVALRASNMTVHLQEGYIIGDVSIGKEVTLNTLQNGGALAVRVQPGAPANSSAPEPAILKTYSGRGFTEIVYEPSKWYGRRPIQSTHLCSTFGTVQLDYSKAGFNGLIDYDVSSRRYTPGLHPICPVKPDPDSLRWWTHYAGNRDGFDRMQVRSPQGFVDLHLLPGSYWPPSHHRSY